MCGIVGFTGKEQAAPILLEGLSKLEYRGYDSAGIAVRDGDRDVDIGHIGVRPHKEKINISKEIINKTRGAVAPYAAQIFTHLSVVSSR